MSFPVCFFSPLTLCSFSFHFHSIFVFHLENMQYMFTISYKLFEFQLLYLVRISDPFPPSPSKTNYGVIHNCDSYHHKPSSIS